MDGDRILAAIAEGRREHRLEMNELRDEFRNELTRFREEFVQFRVDVMGRFDRVENQITGLRDDTTVAVASATLARRQHREARVETLDLIELMTVTQRQVRRLRTEMDELKDRPAAE